MKVTEVRINKYEKNNVKGFATITIDDDLVISGFTIVDGSKGLFVSMPNTKGKDGEYHDTVFPLSKKGRDGLNKIIIDAYKKSTNNLDDDENPFA